MEKEVIKPIIANILYLDNLNQLHDDGSLFAQYDLSSIDFIDLCFELEQAIKIKFKPEELWPFDNMLTNPEFYSQDKWTEKGWAEICSILGIDVSVPTFKSISDLYQHFTVNYIHRRLSAFICVK